MFRAKRTVVIHLTLIAAIGLPIVEALAGTIIKLDLGSDPDPSADVEFSGGSSGILSTVDDGDATRIGDQNTEIDFFDFLGSPNIQGSFSLDNLTTTGPASTVGPLVIQNFSGGTLSLYNSLNALLLTGTLANSALTGPIGAPATGSLFTTSFATVTGGTLQPVIVPNSLTLSMSLGHINGGVGFAVSGTSSALLNAFQADATLSIAGQEVPEPPVAATVMAVASTGLVVFAGRLRPVRS
jgi:hypothetical protein